MRWKLLLLLLLVVRIPVGAARLFGVTQGKLPGGAKGEGGWHMVEIVSRLINARLELRRRARGMGDDSAEQSAKKKWSNDPIGSTWPTFFPTSCPPSEAITAGGVVHRLVSNNPPKPDDFLPWSIENGRLAKSDPCKSCALSVFDRLEDVRRLQRRVPGQRSKSVAQGELIPNMGVTLPTPGKEPTHRSWWAPDGLDPSPAFQVVAPPLSEEDIIE